MYGWTVPYKWGHPVAIFPVTNGTIRHTRRMTEILRIITPFPGTNPICRVPIPITLRTNCPMYNNENAAGFRSQPPDHSPKSIF
eukprot:4099030-Pleurochrysis_carterae.AAC.1